ncbi:MAG: flagellar protein export ATPase FliI [Bacteroidota bacterium]|nr:flagellar protein export ATPase FliI [Candidatus Kapabacteria bacterium]MCS7302780.1 flagellar protein export ATPase FliI [Candidatus Kapabacteria bacterium]MCX7937759.1 flagellar protein export ATPase FliI [Chlorobiota bacterium]MDW8075461.1 flagellar protein export ATPase FliI [Bacteroidota bacterium]MDW8272318.1 flagellar protein export ATPase FliI [Bacteroidota bacterium]
MNNNSTLLSKRALIEHAGTIANVIGITIESIGPQAAIGELLHLRTPDGQCVAECEVVGFRDNRIISMVLGETHRLMPGMKLIATGRSLEVELSPALLGRILDGIGRPLDDRPLPPPTEQRPIYAAAPPPLTRQRIRTPLITGIRAIDGMLTIGKGQRVGIFAGSGVGKSTLLGMLARHTSADVNVIALIGERGREVREFLEKDLGPEGLERSVVVCATSDQPALLRIKAALVATTIAEYFRDQGLDVLLMMDSVTRLAMAQREVGLAIGEPPTTKGYTPSVFAMLHSVMERAGTSHVGTITALYTVLVEGDDMNEPIADAARGILDGHIVLTRKLAQQGHYPAIDVLQSISRIMDDIITPEHRSAAMAIKELLALYAESEDLIAVGAYQSGTNPLLDRAIAFRPAIVEFLRQQKHEFSPFEQTLERLKRLIAP